MKVLIITTILALTCFININSHGQEVSINYSSPVSGAKYVNPEQTIILKTGIPFEKQSVDYNKFSIVGSVSGNHSFTWKFSKDYKTIVIIPDSYFTYGETITFTLKNGLFTNTGLEVTKSSFSFKIMAVDNLPLLKNYCKQEYEKELKSKSDYNSSNPRKTRNNYNTPDDYPCPETTIYTETDNKYLFFTLDPRVGAMEYKKYLSINDKYGIPLFYRKLPQNCLYFHQMEDGNLAYARNEYGFPENEQYFFMDSSYRVVDSVKTGNGYDMDAHDILLLENGNYLLMSYDPQPIDMSLIILGGNPNAVVIGFVIQEVGIDGTVYFQWRSWDHFLITDATDDINLYGSNIDYVHGNAFDIDMDGNLLLSSRHLDEITKINFLTGNIIYRFGLNSKNNQFTISNDTYGFSHQHDIRVLPNGNITIFDNGNLHPTPFSRALEYSINEVSKTAELIWFYRNNPDIYGSATGSYRRDESGKSLIGWGTTWPIAATEVLQDNTKSLDVILPDGVYSYRVIKSTWRTNMFTSLQHLHFGNYSGYTPQPKHIVIPVYNNSDHQIRIGSHYLHNDFFNLVDNFPIIIDSHDTIEVTLGFNPQDPGIYNDILTLNYDKYTLTDSERVAIQIELSGIWDTSQPEVSFDPVFGTTNVNPNTEIIVAFSEPVNKIGGEPITNSDIRNLFRFKKNNQWGTDVLFSGIISGDRTQITIFPDESLNEQQNYFIELIASSVESDSAIIINYPESTFFETGLHVNTELVNDSDKITVFPSPFNNKLFINVLNENISSVCIYNISGYAIFESKSMVNEIELDTKHFPDGLYFVKMKDITGNIRVIKIIKSSQY
jgi:arylsulfotransferase ASST/type IX secretion system substrate protein/Big-like domain-containing protein